jgi:hypothetical protein
LAAQGNVRAAIAADRRRIVFAIELPKIDMLYFFRVLQ